MKTDKSKPIINDDLGPTPLYFKEKTTMTDAQKIAAIIEHLNLINDASCVDEALDNGDITDYYCGNEDDARELGYEHGQFCLKRDIYKILGLEMPKDDEGE